MQPSAKAVDARNHAPRTVETAGARSALHPRGASLQQILGNSHLQRLLQAKLTVSEPGDAYEQEADRVADDVMRMPEPVAAASSADSAPPRIQRLCTECEEELHRKVHPGDEARSVQTGHKRARSEPDASTIEPYVDSLAARGTPLTPASRAFFEPRFGADFSAVRVHTGAEADRSAKAINAHAFTTGSHIVFRAGRYDPDGREGKHLLAHELTHVLQQDAQASAPAIQTRVVDDDEHLPCRATTGRDAAFLSAREAAAATMAEEAATALRASPIGEPERRLLWERFRLDYNEPVIRCRQVAEIADRFARAALEMRGTDCVYHCEPSGQPAGMCSEGGYDAVTNYNPRSIDLCDGFWNAASDADRETILLHEWMHYVYRTRGVADEPAGGFDTADCYAYFADARRRGAAARDDGSCPARSEPLPAADPTRQTQECPSNVFATFSALGGYAYGLGGQHYGMVSAGFDLNFPLTRMHDWEFTLGPRFTALLPSDAPSRASYLEGIRAGVSFRYRPWRFGFQVGGYAEGGRASLANPDETSTEHPYLAGGVAAALNFRLGERTALQVAADVGGGAVLGRIEPALGDEARRGWFGVGLGVALQIK